MKNVIATYLRTIILGITDGIVSTVGLLAGIEIAGVPRHAIVLTGLVYVVIESFSMAAGAFLAEESAEEYTARSDVPDRVSGIAGIVMFVAFGLSSAIPLVPFFIFPGTAALGVSILASIIALFIAGLIGARIARLPMLWRGVRMALLGGAAILIGLVIGALFPPAP